MRLAHRQSTLASPRNEHRFRPLSPLLLIFDNSFSVLSSSAHSTSSRILLQKQNRGKCGYPTSPECGRTGDFRQRRLISLLEFSDKPGASKFREKCRKHSQNGKSMEHYRQFRRPSGMRLRFSRSPGVETPGYCQWSLRDLPCPTTSTTPRFFVP
jgi:hypothetical protein